MKRILHSIQTLGLLLIRAYQREGPWYAIRKGCAYVAMWPIDVLVPLFNKYFNKNISTFTFRGQPYNYYFHSYNATRKNERSVEIPIIWQIVQENSDKRILEIGNVLRHYFPCSHDTVDLTERYPGVIIRDITDFRPGNKYELIVSISTFEHIGCWEKGHRQPEKLLQAIENVMENVLTAGGEFILTVPFGYNPDMDSYLADGTIKFNSSYCMKQTDAKMNSWQESPWSEIREHEFNTQGEWCGKHKTLLIGIMKSAKDEMT